MEFPKSPNATTRVNNKKRVSTWAFFYTLFYFIFVCVFLSLANQFWNVWMLSFFSTNMMNIFSLPYCNNTKKQHKVQHRRWHSRDRPYFPWKKHFYYILFSMNSKSSSSCIYYCFALLYRKHADVMYTLLQSSPSCSTQFSSCWGKRTIRCRSFICIITQSCQWFHGAAQNTIQAVTAHSSAW